MNIRDRLYTSAAMMITMGTLIASVFVVSSINIDAENAKHERAHLMNMEMGKLNILAHRYMLRFNEKVYRDWKEVYYSIQGMLDDLSRLVREAPYDRTLLSSIENDYASSGVYITRLYENYNKRASLLSSGASQIEIDATYDVEKKFSKDLTNTLESIINDSYELSASCYKRAVEAQRIANIMTLSLIISFTLLMTFASFIFAGTITKPLDSLMESVAIIGRGDFNHKVKVHKKDEIGNLAVAFNKMTDNLRHITASRDELNREVSQRRRAQEELEVLKEQLEEKGRQRTTELQERVEELERFHDATIDRELRMKELKRKIEGLESQQKTDAA